MPTVILAYRDKLEVALSGQVLSHLAIDVIYNIKSVESGEQLGLRGAMAVR